MAIRVERGRDGIAEVVVDAPPVNALTACDLAALAATLEDLGRDAEVSVVILRSGIDRGFVAGLDVTETGDDTAAAVEISQAAAAAYGAVSGCDVPVIAAVHGFCLGPGVGLVANADVIVASEDASFGLPEADCGRLGLVPHLARLVPPSKARWLAYSCERIGADELHAYGTVERVVPREDLLAVARNLAGTIAAATSVAVRRVKESLRTSDDAGLSARGVLSARQ